MKIEIVEENPILPPKKVIVEMSEAEACIIYWALNYYSAIGLITVATAAGRASNQFKQFRDKAVYPYTKEFV